MMMGKGPMAKERSLPTLKKGEENMVVAKEGVVVSARRGQTQGKYAIMCNHGVNACTLGQ